MATNKNQGYRIANGCTDHWMTPPPPSKKKRNNPLGCVINLLGNCEFNTRSRFRKLNSCYAWFYPKWQKTT